MNAGLRTLNFMRCSEIRTMLEGVVAGMDGGGEKIEMEIVLVSDFMVCSEGYRPEL